MNENEIKKIMNKNGFENVRLSDLHFADQVQLFYQADYIVGLHGAAFANLVFCRPNTKVLEFQSTTAGQVIENIAKANNLIYSAIRCEPIDYDFSNLLRLKYQTFLVQDKLFLHIHQNHLKWVLQQIEVGLSKMVIYLHNFQLIYL